jgi:hypothetical protein
MQCSDHLQPLVNLMHDRLLESPVIHCDETRLQVLKEPDRDPGSQSWMWVQTGGPPARPVILFDYTSSRAQDVPQRLLAGYRGYLMTDDYAGYNAIAAQEGESDWVAGRTPAASSSTPRKPSPKARQVAPIWR